MEAVPTTTTELAVVVADADEKPTRRFPPPCWTQEETLALIDAYRERWYALRRGYLRTADWDAVAAAVSRRCPGASTAKTSAQCRHKMEKLRQRYRAEKQRALSYPTGRFFSSWFFYENMDAMENGNSPKAVSSNQDLGNPAISDPVLPLKSLVDQNLLRLKLNPRNKAKIVGDSNPAVSFDHGVRAKTSEKLDEKLSSNRVVNVYSSYLDYESGMKTDAGEDNTELGNGFGFRSPIETLVAPSFKSRKPGKYLGDLRNGFDPSNGFHHLKPSIHQDLFLSAPRGIKHGKIERRVTSNFNSGVAGGCDENDRFDGSDGFWSRLETEMNSGRQGSWGGCRMSSDEKFDCKVNGFADCSTRPDSVKKRTGDWIKRKRDPMEEMVSSIKLLGEGFIQMEKMKMEMARDFEKMRMEMEMKRNELILESQQQIVDAFVKLFAETRIKKVKRVVPDST